MVDDYISHLVAEYIQYDNSVPFQPLQLSYAVTDVEQRESMHEKLTDLVQYYLRYQLKGRPVVISFGLGANVAVNSIIGLPTLRQWGGLLEFCSNKFVAPAINTGFPLL